MAFYVFKGGIEPGSDQYPSQAKPLCQGRFIICSPDDFIFIPNGYFIHIFFFVVDFIIQIVQKRDLSSKQNEKIFKYSFVEEITFLYIKKNKIIIYIIKKGSHTLKLFLALLYFCEIEIERSFSC